MTPKVFGPKSNIDKFIKQNRQHLRVPINKFLKSKIYGMHSLSILSSNWLKKINSSDADIIHLHWIQGEMISIDKNLKIEKPVRMVFSRYVAFFWN